MSAFWYQCSIVFGPVLKLCDGVCSNQDLEPNHGGGSFCYSLWLPFKQPKEGTSKKRTTAPPRISAFPLASRSNLRPLRSSSPSAGVLVAQPIGGLGPDLEMSRGGLSHLRQQPRARRSRPQGKFQAKFQCGMPKGAPHVEDHHVQTNLQCI